MTSKRPCDDAPDDDDPDVDDPDVDDPDVDEADAAVSRGGAGCVFFGAAFFAVEPVDVFFAVAMWQTYPTLATGDQA